MNTKLLISDEKVSFLFETCTWLKGESQSIRVVFFEHDEQGHKSIRDIMEFDIHQIRWEKIAKAMRDLVPFFVNEEAIEIIDNTKHEADAVKTTFKNVRHFNKVLRQAIENVRNHPQTKPPVIREVDVGDIDVLTPTSWTVEQVVAFFRGQWPDTTHSLSDEELISRFFVFTMTSMFNVNNSGEKFLEFLREFPSSITKLVPDKPTIN